MADGENGELGVLIDAVACPLGYSCLMEEQKKAVELLLSVVFVSLPMGNGKSLCYALLPLIFDKQRETMARKSIVMVFSPLVALMNYLSAKFVRSTSKREKQFSRACCMYIL